MTSRHSGVGSCKHCLRTRLLLHAAVCQAPAGGGQRVEKWGRVSSEAAQRSPWPVPSNPCSPHVCTAVLPPTHLPQLPSPGLPAQRRCNQRRSGSPSAARSEEESQRESVSRGRAHGSAAAMRHNDRQTARPPDNQASKQASNKPASTRLLHAAGQHLCHRRLVRAQIDAWHHLHATLQPALAVHERHHLHVCGWMGWGSGQARVRGCRLEHQPRPAQQAPDPALPRPSSPCIELTCWALKPPQYTRLSANTSRSCSMP